MQSRNKPNYEGAVKKAQKARNTNVILCGVVILAALAMGVVSVFTAYRVFGLLTAVIVAAAALILLLKNMNEASAAMAIAKNSIYATPVSSKEMETIRKHQNRRGQRFYFTVMLALLVPETIVLTILYFISGSSVYLFFMAGFALVCLLVTLFSVLYLNRRFSVKNPVCLISGKGILIGQEILPFNAEKGDALLLFRFSDFYCLKFIKSAFLGIRYESDIIFPADGALRAGLEGTCDEELRMALELDGVFVTDDPFYESRDYLGESEVEGYEEEDVSDDMLLQESEDMSLLDEDDEE